MDAAIYIKRITKVSVIYIFDFSTANRTDGIAYEMPLPMGHAQKFF